MRAIRATIGAIGLCGVSAMLALAAGVEPEPVVDTDQGDALAVARSFQESLGGGDRSAALSVLAEDVVIFEHGGVERTRSEYASHHLGADMAFLANLESEIVGERVIGGDNLVVLAREIRQHGTYEDADLDRITTETLVLEKRTEGWLISHIHWSGE